MKSDIDHNNNMIFKYLKCALYIILAMVTEVIVRLKLKLINFVERNCNEYDFLEKALKYGSNYRIIVHKNVEEYQRRHIQTTRLFVCLLITIMAFLFFVGGTASVVVKDHWMTSFLTKPMKKFFKGLSHDAFIFGAFRLAFSNGFLMYAIALGIWQYQEINYKNLVFKFIVDYTERNVSALNSYNSRRIGLKVVLLSKVTLNIYCNGFIMIMCFVITIPSLMSYLTGDFDSGIIELILIIYGHVAFLVILLHVILSLCWIICIVTFCLLYLNYKFNEINDKFLLGLHLRHVSHLELIEEHYQLCKLTYHLNKLIKVFILLLYYLATPNYMFMVNELQQDHLKPTYKVIDGLVFIISFGANFGVYLLASRISYSSRRPLKYLHKYMIKSRLTFQEKLKTMAFMESLRGPDIGFYCFDFFPLNSYEFYLYIANCTKTYIMINGLLR